MIEMRKLSTEENDFIDLLREYSRASGARKVALRAQLDDMLDNME